MVFRKYFYHKIVTFVKTMFSIYGDGGVQNVFPINYKIFMLK